jgi:hypothetical protein
MPSTSPDSFCSLSVTITDLFVCKVVILLFQLSRKATIGFTFVARCAGR